MSVSGYYKKCGALGEPSGTLRSYVRVTGVSYGYSNVDETRTVIIAIHVGRSSRYWREVVDTRAESELPRSTGAQLGYVFGDSFAETSSVRSRLPKRAVQYNIIYKHSIATSRCRETEWLLCGAHIVLVPRSSLVLRRT